MVRKESMAVIAETCGIAKLPDKVAATIAKSVEQRLRDIVQDSMKFMKHSRREELTTEDVSNALRLRKIQVSCPSSCVACSLYNVCRHSTAVVRFLVF